MNRSLIILIAFVAGCGMALQVGFNNTLKARAGHPIFAALVSFGTGTLVLVVLAWTARGSLTAPVKGPWWMWMGGMTGVFYVISSAALSQRLGSAGWLSVIIAGQIFASLILDHYGLVGFSTHPAHPLRLAGAALLLLGVYLVLRF